MKKLLAIVLVILAGAYSLTAKGLPSGAGDEQRLIELEKELSAALVRQDAVVLNRLWSDSLVFTFPDGGVSNKAERLASQKPSAQPTQADSEMSNDNEVVKVHLYGNTAVVTVLSTWRGGANNHAYSTQFQATHVWVKEKGRWQLVAAHVSQIKK